MPVNNTPEYVYELIEEQLKAGKDVIVTPTGISMKPMISGNEDSVKLILPPLKLKKYDVIFYKRDNGQYVIHRIISVNNNSYTLCGDNQTTLERGVTRAQIIGYMSAFQHKGKWLSSKQCSYRWYSFCWVNTRALRKLLFAIFSKIRELLKRKVEDVK